MKEAKMKQGGGVIERFGEFLPPCNAVISLGEGNTPLVFSPKLSARVGRGCQVFIKNEGLNPTGSFKDRGMTVAVSRAIDRGARTLICASTGNTSASAAAYAARAGIACAVVLPAGKIASGKLIQAFAHGAKIVAIDGNITAYWAGYQEYQTRGRSTKLPAMIGFQAAGAAPIFHDKTVPKPETIASAIRIGNPASWKQARAALDESKGDVDVVTDEEILAAQSWLAQNEGIFVEPASAASIAGLLNCSQKFRERSKIVCTVTGHGLKDPDSIKSKIGDLEPVPAKIDNVRRAIGF